MIGAGSLDLELLLKPDRFSRIIASNTLIATGRGVLNDMFSFIAYLIFKFAIWFQGPATGRILWGRGFTGWI